ncbi:FusB/FusC family EF-G-binding protein [Cytobacillus purgationiresistens]|uniref:Elongation factor G-binding protein n=1 Tax=Cytobacillus purgationiresistens TaxID=863449 RepID=A0ABU0AS13_9BACI|nr:FusB/FusC family EF-G-binding protein [Cytobacillus purgationiresistens]MDQ0272840.1 hypothetical protein [Cytobacillus purgationiresistens]
MEAFIRNDQYNLIKIQTKALINGHSSVNEATVLQAVQSLALEKTKNAFDEITDEQMELLLPIIKVKDRSDEEVFLGTLKPYVIPFQKVIDKTVKKLFPKAKKLKLPSMENSDWEGTSFLSWDDKGTNRRYIIAPFHQKLVGLHGSFHRSNHKGICAICNKFSTVGMFTHEVKGEASGTFIRRGNYICEDSQSCNMNISSLVKLEEFISHLKRKDALNEKGSKQ